MTRPDSAPRASLIVALYALAGLAWLAVARLIVPSVLTAAYHGQGLPILTRLLAARPHPVDYYLSLWLTVADALLLVLVLHLAIVLALTRAGRPSRGRSILLLFSFIVLVATAVSRARHDYHAHLMIWRVVLDGTDPWWLMQGQVLNAYGPLFNALRSSCPLAVSVGLWGSSTFHPLTAAAARPAEMLSIFAFLQGRWSPLEGMVTTATLDRCASLSLIAAGLGVFVWCWRRAIDRRAAVVAAMLTTLLFYKVGHVQYQLMLGPLVLYWLATAPDECNPPGIVSSYWERGP